MKRLFFFVMCLFSSFISFSQCDSTEIVNQICKCKTFLADAFTTNNDGLNDYFGFDFNCEISSNYNLKLFNRLGQLVFETNDHTEKWNGKHDETICSPGIYSYLLTFQFKYEEQERTISRKVTLKH